MTASYRFGVQWITEHVPVEPADLYHPQDSLTEAGRVAVDLLADLFAIEPERVAADVLRARS